MIQIFLPDAFSSKVLLLFGILCLVWGLPTFSQFNSRFVLFLSFLFLVLTILINSFPNSFFISLFILVVYAFTLRYFFIPKYIVLQNEFSWVFITSLIFIVSITQENTVFEVVCAFLLVGILCRFDRLENKQRLFLFILSLTLFLFIFLFCTLSILDTIQKNPYNTSFLQHFLSFTSLLILLSTLLLFVRGLITPIINLVQKHYTVRFKLILSFLFTSIVPLLFSFLLFWMFLILLIGKLNGRLLEAFLLKKSDLLVQEVLSNFNHNPIHTISTTPLKLFVKDTVNVEIGLFQLQTSKKSEHKEFIPVHSNTDFRYLVYNRKKIDYPFYGIVTGSNAIYVFAFIEKEKQIVGIRKILSENDFLEIENHLQCSMNLYNISNTNSQTPSTEVQVSNSDSTFNTSLVQVYQSSFRDTTSKKPFFLLFGVTWLANSNFSSSSNFSVGTLAIFYVTFSQLKSFFINETNPVGSSFWYILGFLSILLFLFVFVVVHLGVQITNLLVQTTLRLLHGTFELRKGNLEHRIPVESKDELGELSYSFNLMASDISKLLSEVRIKERIEHDLEIARNIQKNLFPSSPPKFQGWEIASRNETAYQVGGDFYDFIELANDNLVITLGDVSGKGISAALLMSNVQAALRLLASSSLDPSKVIEKLNNELVKTTSPEIFVTLFYAVLNLKTGLVKYVNAGHDNPIVLRNSSTYEELSIGGTVVGSFVNIPYHTGEITLQSGDFLIIFSDGIP
ncbi:MAG: SpoIIE family protein phosphatase [bacterium]|nr:SpoIIE family protein phosphatase [bacterium]